MPLNQSRWFVEYLTFSIQNLSIFTEFQLYFPLFCQVFCGFCDHFFGKNLKFLQSDKNAFHSGRDADKECFKRLVVMKLRSDSIVGEIESCWIGC